jgi:hypothetical protein
MAKKKKKSRRKARKAKRKNPTRRCSNCRSAKHDRRKCKSKKKSKRTCRKSRRNPGVADSLSEMALSYSYGKPRRNPCITCGCTCKDGAGCTCKDGAVDTTRNSYKDMAAGAGRFLRSRMRRMRRNPGWSFKKGRVTPHEQQFEDLYQKPSSRHFRRNPYRRNWLAACGWCGEPHCRSCQAIGVARCPECNEKNCSCDLAKNPCGSRRHGTTRNPWGFYGPLSRHLRRNPTTACGSCGTGNDTSRRETCWKCGFDLASSPEGRIAATRRRAMGGRSWY